MARSLRRLAITGAVTAIAALGVVGAATAANPPGTTASTPTSDGSVTPYILDNPGPGGNVSCSQLGLDSLSERVNHPFPPDPFPGITVTDDGTYLEWTSQGPVVQAVIVKGSNAANIYDYRPISDPPVMTDSGLAPPPNASGGPAGISNVTFCGYTPTVIQGLVSGMKYYDANANGQLDAGEPGIEAWPIDYANGESGTLYTDENGEFQKLLGAGTYTFAEQQASPPWIQTGNTTNQATPQSKVTLNNFVYTVEVAASGDISGLNFGNVCVGAGGGKTLGFWSNRNGQAMIDGTDLAALTALNLVDGNGNAFDPASYSAFRTWLLDANATNMAYMLSAQLAAMKLNVFNGLVSGSALVYAPGVTGANAAGFISVNALIAEANAQLAADGYTPAGDPNRAYQELIKNALDKANNNYTFLQPTPETCPAPVFPTVS